MERPEILKSYKVNPITLKEPILKPALFMCVLLSHAFDVDLLSCTAANGAASHRGTTIKEACS